MLNIAAHNLRSWLRMLKAVVEDSRSLVPFFVLVRVFGSFALETFLLLHIVVHLYLDDFFAIFNLL